MFPRDLALGCKDIDRSSRAGRGRELKEFNCRPIRGKRILVSPESEWARGVARGMRRREGAAAQQGRAKERSWGRDVADLRGREKGQSGLAGKSIPSKAPPTPPVPETRAASRRARDCHLARLLIWPAGASNFSAQRADLKFKSPPRFFYTIRRSLRLSKSR